MFRHVLIAMGGLALFSGLLRACRIPWQAAPEPVGTVIGDMVPWSENAPVAGRQVVLCRAVADPRLGDCVLMARWATTDASGHFEITEVPAGTYFVLYDSGLSDFEQAMELWGGQTLHFGDDEWLSTFLGEDPRQEDRVYRLPEGLKVTPHERWVQAYCTLTLLVGRSPFIIAHDIEHAAEQNELRCLVFNVVENVARRLDIQVTYFADVG